MRSHLGQLLSEVLLEREDFEDRVKVELSGVKCTECRVS